MNNLDRIEGERSFPIRRLKNLDETWAYRGPIRRVDFGESNVISKITEAVERKEPLHLVPLAPHFPAVDSIIYDPNDAKAVLTYIRVTITERHPIAVKNFQRIQSWLNPNYHHLNLSALQKPSHGASYSLRRQTMRLVS